MRTLMGTQVNSHRLAPSSLKRQLDWQFPSTDGSHYLEGGLVTGCVKVFRFHTPSLCGQPGNFFRTLVIDRLLLLWLLLPTEVALISLLNDVSRIMQ